MRYAAVILAAVLAYPVAGRAAVASCYGAESGPTTASGERFDPKAMTAAHRTLPFGTYVRVVYQGRSVVVKITDRGPFIRGRDIDLSTGACARIGLLQAGVGQVEMQITDKPFAPPTHGWFNSLWNIVPAHDDGRYAQAPLKAWFDKLQSGKGLCCSFADGQRIDDVDWDTQDGKYRVRLSGQWIVVPDDAVVTEPNKFGPAVVWPVTMGGNILIRCFLPGSGA